MGAPIRYKPVGYDHGMEPAHDGPYILAAEHDRLMAEARNKALEDAAMCCEAEADKCDDAVKWNGPGRYARDCKAAAYAMRDRASAIRALKS